MKNLVIAFVNLDVSFIVFCGDIVNPLAEHTNIKRINHIHNLFSMPNIMDYTRLVLTFSNKKVLKTI
jgi:hypothetical protein